MKGKKLEWDQNYTEENGNNLMITLLGENLYFDRKHGSDNFPRIPRSNIEDFCKWLIRKNRTYEKMKRVEEEEKL